MTKRVMAILTACLVMTAGLTALAADGGREANRTRLVSLETLLSAKRAVVKARWTTLGQLDSQIADLIASEPPTPSDPDMQTPEKVRDMAKAAAKRQAVEADRVQVLQALQELYIEVAALQGEIKKVRSELQETQQILDGRWTLVMMPSGTKGDVYMSQNGTLLTGDYKLDNGQTGNLQGTFINNQLFLERIDARYGKMGRFEGTLSKDRQSLKGAWFSYDFASGQPLTGAFSFDRVQEEQAP